MGFIEKVKQARTDARHMEHIDEQGFPQPMAYLAFGMTAGEAALDSQALYAEEKAKRDPLGVAPW
jgi:hypothetical protein